MADEIMTIRQLADYLKLNYQTVYKKAQKREIPASKIGRSWRFQKAVIDRWLAEDKAVYRPNGINSTQSTLF